MNFKEIVQSYEADIIKHISTLVSYNSVLASADGVYPFGKITADCLEKALAIGAEYGFHSVNVDHYAGYLEMGSGEKLIGVLGHLDVVPAGEGWSSDPFTVVQKDGKLFGRGTSDDKGAVVCSMIAMKIVKDYMPQMTKRVRLIMGCNEETGSKCLEYYVAKEGHIDYGFTPDGNFPGCHGEKGAVRLTLHAKSECILDIHAGVAANVVPNQVRLRVKKDSFDEKKFGGYLQANGIKFTLTEKEGVVELMVYGVAAHASTPDLGKNAVSYAIMALHAGGIVDSFVAFYVRKIGLSTNGANMQAGLRDEYGALTFNVGVVRQNGNEITCTVDIRFPITSAAHKVVTCLEAAMQEEQASMCVTSVTEPLFFPPDSPLVTMLHDAYVEVSGDTVSPVITMGGGTYAKGIKNCIAFGGEFPNDNNHIHDADEFVPIRDLLLQTEIYVVALLKLLAA